MFSMLFLYQVIFMGNEFFLCFSFFSRRTETCDPLSSVSVQIWSFPVVLFTTGCGSEIFPPENNNILLPS